MIYYWIVFIAGLVFVMLMTGMVLPELISSSEMSLWMIIVVMGIMFVIIAIVVLLISGFLERRM